MPRSGSVVNSAKICDRFFTRNSLRFAFAARESSSRIQLANPVREFRSRIQVANPNPESRSRIRSQPESAVFATARNLGLLVEGRQDNQHFGVPTTTNGRPSLLRGSDLVETARAGTMSLGRFAILLTKRNAAEAWLDTLQQV